MAAVPNLAQAAQAAQQHINELDAHRLLRRHFEVTKQPLVTHLTATTNQTNLTNAQIHNQKTHDQQMIGFLNPHHYAAGTMPLPDDPAATLVNGFGLACENHLIREDGTAENPVPGREDCTCGTWYFRAFGCGHLYAILEDNRCGRTRMATSGKARLCRGTKGLHHTTKATVVGPCVDRGCTWWAQREGIIRAHGDWVGNLVNGYGLTRVWKYRV